MKKIDDYTKEELYILVMALTELDKMSTSRIEDLETAIELYKNAIENLKKVIELKNTEIQNYDHLVNELYEAIDELKSEK